MDFEAFSGERIDKAVAALYSEMSRAYIAKLIEEGHITVNGKKTKAGYRLRDADAISVSVPTPKPMQAIPQDIPLSVVYEDDALLVINKPADMVVHPAAGNYEHTLVNALLHYCGSTLSTIGGVQRPGIVHRIDKDTTGLLVVAKGDASHKHLSAQLKARTLKRQYFALVHGNVTEENGRINAPIGRSTSDRKKMAVVKNGGRDAVTNYEVLERFGKYTLLKCILETGRTHQIRVHMRHIGHPIVGDKTYGVKKEAFHLDGQLLHAGIIGFIHPNTGEKMEFSAPLPSVFEKVLYALRKESIE